MRPRLALAATLCLCLVAVLPAGHADQAPTTTSAPAGPAVTLLSPEPRVGDSLMVVQVLGVQLVTPGTTNASEPAGFLIYRHNGIPCGGTCAAGQFAATNRTSFTFHDLQAGDRVSVELVHLNGTAYTPRVFLERPVLLTVAPEALPKVLIRTGSPNAGVYTMEVEVRNFTVLDVGSGLPNNRTQGHLRYLLNGSPCVDACAAGVPSETTARSFTFHGLVRGDLVGVQLVQNDGKPFVHDLRNVQVVTAPTLVIASGTPLGGKDYTLNVSVAGFTLTPPQTPPASNSAGTGHIHYLLCARDATTNDVKDCHPAPGNYATSDLHFTYHDLKVGDVVAAELVNNDHSSLNPAVRVVVDTKEGTPEDPLAPGIGPLLAVAVLACAAVARRITR